MRSFLGLVLFFGLQSVGAFALGTVPSDPPAIPNNLHCLDKQRQSMTYNNSQVVTWESSTPDQYLDRGLVYGTIQTIYPNKTGHTHFALSMAGGGGIEIIYNDEFGELPALKPGMQVIACGDYITVGPKARLPSPMPAILHWVHFNPGTRDGGRHPGGFLIIGGSPYGFTTPANN